METEDCPDQDQNFQNNYEHDSDVEARLYAEVYFSNTIIGEENNTNNTVSENQCPDAVNDFYKRNGNNQGLLQDKNVTQDKSNGNIICDNNLAITLNDSTNNVSTNIQNLTKAVNTENTSNFSKQSASTYKINDLRRTSNTSNSKKRTSNDKFDEVNKSNKKKKHENQNGLSYQFNGPSSELQSSQEKTNQNDGSALINPYNNNVVNNGKKIIKLLSPEFIDIFFTGKSRKKKKKYESVKKDQIKKTSNTIPDTSIIQQPSNVEPVVNSLENDISTNSSIIDISSESSNESFESDSKYNTIVATDRKLKDRESGLKNTSTNDASDSEESIFEVPIPPKPVPPVIEVRDSDNERENQSSEDSFLNDTLTSVETIIQNDHEISLDSSLNKTQDTCEIISDSEDSDGLILNCTDVQRGVSTLDEIKKMNQQTLTPIQRNSNLTNSFNSPQNKSGTSHNPAVIENSSDSLKSKQKPKSSSKNISSAEYYFQPMNEKMKSFYNDSWGGENFDMDEMKSKMSTDPNKWAILNKDLVITGPRKKRYFGMVCARCHKDGHRQNNCPEPNKGPTCHMCGANGHYATYCPHTKCLTCGRQQTMYRTTCGYCKGLFCTRCRSQGHRDDACPDLWRRYHHTTNSPAPKIPLNVKNVMKSRHDLFCCNCTKQGHDSPACKRLRWSQHFPNPSSVTHYSGPSYTATGNSDVPVIVDDLRETLNNKYYNSMTSNTISTNFPHPDRRNENNIQSNVDGSPSVSDFNKKIIFDVCRMKTKFDNKTQSQKSAIRSVTLKLNVPDKNNPGSVEKWKKLTDFLKGLGYDLSSEFRLEQKDKQLLLYMKSSRKYIESLSTLINQYSSRSEFERSQMLLSCVRDLKIIVGNLSRKFAEMKNVSEDISTLYKETRQLRKELLDNEGHVQNETKNRLKLNELVLSQQKLLMLLYREGFGDESLGQLRKVFLKMQKSIEQHSDKRKMKKNSKYVPVVPLLSFKILFTYLYYYNNIFVSYESKKLDSYFQKYKDNLDKRNKLLNSSLLFPQGTNEKQTNSNGNPVQNSICSEKTSEDSSEPSTSTFQELPILQNTTAEIPVNSTSNISLNSELPNQTLVSPKHKNERKLNYLYLQAINTQNQTRKANLMQNFRNFLKNARNCLEQASKLNSPRLHDDIVALQRELEDETHINTNKVRKFKKKVREERLKLSNQFVPKKKKKSHKNAKTTPPNDADNIYKKFCASL